jgi:hypothetical protein
MQEQVDLLLRRRLVEDKVGGSPASELEANAVLETVELTLFLHPRTAFYVGHLARNGLSKIVSDELAQVREVSSAVRDLGNQSFALTNLKALKRAKTSLLQLDQQGRISSTSGAFQNFDSAVNEFLNGPLSKNVRRKGGTEMVRPGVEAASQLPGYVAVLKDLHADTVARFEWLRKGLQEYLVSGVAGRISRTTASRISQVVDEMLSGLKSDPQATLSRQYVTQLIAAKTALGMVGSVPDPYVPVVSTTRKIPSGSVLEARCDQHEVRVRTIPWPTWALDGYGPTFTFSIRPPVDLSLTGAQNYPNYLLTGPMQGPPFHVVTTGGLYYSVGGRDYVLPLSAGYYDLNSIVSLLGTAVPFDGFPPTAAITYTPVVPVQIAFNSDQPVTILSMVLDDTDPLAPAVLDSSLHETFGLEAGQSSNTAYSVEDMLSFLNREIVAQGASSYMRVERVGDAIDLVIDLLPNETVTISGAIFNAHPAILLKAQATRFSLYGTVYGTPQTVTAKGLVRAGDIVEFPNGTIRVVKEIDDQGMVVTTEPFDSYDGPLTIRPSLEKMWNQLHGALDAFVSVWTAYGYSKNLNRLDSLIAPLYSSPTPARRAEALEALQVLEQALEELQTVLDAGPVPTDIEEERTDVEGVITLLQERQYDKALSYLLSFRLRDLLLLGWQSLSFGGDLMSKMSDIAQKDIAWPNQSADEGFEVDGVDTAKRSAP